MNFTTKAVLYLRVSTREQGKSGLGLDAQKNLCIEVCEKLNIEIVGIYQEIISGKKKPIKRDVFKEALSIAQKNKAAIMVAKLDRFSRDIAHLTDFTNGYMVKNCPKLICADNPNASEFEINIRASISQEERKMISQRTKAALQIKKEQGYELGKQGRKAATEQARQLTQNAINIAYQYYQQGYSYQKIADILNQQGYKTSRGSNWTKQALTKRLPKKNIVKG